MAGQEIGYFRGEGGSIIKMALPLSRIMAKQERKGQIRRVNPDGSPYKPGLAPEPEPETSGGPEVQDPDPEPSTVTVDAPEPAADPEPERPRRRPRKTTEASPGGE